MLLEKLESDGAMSLLPLLEGGVGRPLLLDMAARLRL